MTGDLTKLNGEVVAVKEDVMTGQPMCVIQVRMSNQNDDTLAKGHVDVRLPTEDMPKAENPEG
jgi:hypothetical protein